MALSLRAITVVLLSLCFSGGVFGMKYTTYGNLSANEIGVLPGSYLQWHLPLENLPKIFYGTWVREPIQDEESASIAAKEVKLEITAHYIESVFVDKNGKKSTVNIGEGDKLSYKQEGDAHVIRYIVKHIDPDTQCSSDKKEEVQLYFTQSDQDANTFFVEISGGPRMKYTKKVTR